MRISIAGREQIFNNCQQHKNIACCTKMFLWRIYVAGKNSPYFGLHIMFPIFLSNFNPIWTFSIDCHKSSHYPISLKFIQGESRRYGRTDGHAPNWRFSPLIQTQDALRKDERTNSTLRVKEQALRLTLQSSWWRKDADTSKNWNHLTRNRNR